MVLEILASSIHSIKLLTWIFISEWSCYNGKRRFWLGGMMHHRSRPYFTQGIKGSDSKVDMVSGAYVSKVG